MSRSKAPVRNPTDVKEPAGAAEIRGLKIAGFRSRWGAFGQVDAQADRRLGAGRCEVLHHALAIRFDVVGERSSYAFAAGDYRASFG